MKSTLSEQYQGPRLPRGVQVQRLQKVIREELTELQRQVLVGYYFQELTLEEMAQYRGVNRSTIWRTLRRAEGKIMKYIKYG